MGGGEAGWDNLLGRVVGRVVGRMVGPTWWDEEAPNPVHHLAPAAELLSSRFSEFGFSWFDTNVDLLPKTRPLPS